MYNFLQNLGNFQVELKVEGKCALTFPWCSQKKVGVQIFSPLTVRFLCVCICSWDANVH